MNTPNIIQSAEPFLLPGGRTGCLLVHGFTGTPHEMRWLGEQLNGEGHTVLGVRLSAHATQPRDMIRARWRDWIISVEDGWHLLSKSVDCVAIIGLSMGGVLSLLFAAHYPVAGVVALATPHHLPDDPRLRVVKPLSILKPYFPKGDPDWVDMQAYDEHILYPVDPTRAYAELSALIEAMRVALPSVTAPALLINSRDDQVVRAGEGHLENIYASLGSQEKKFLWIENSGHVITRDASKHLVSQEVASFVKSLSEKQS